MKLARVREGLPGWKNVLLALLSSVLLVLAFPDFDLWWMAWFALVPMMWAVEREKGSIPRATIIGWIFGTAFFFGSCWWLTSAPITYAGFPPIVAYLLLFFAAAGAGIFPGIFAGLLAYLLRRFGSVAMLAAPFVWVATEFTRYWITGNNWNALGYSQAFSDLSISGLASVGGVLLVSFYLAVASSFFTSGLITYFGSRRKGLSNWLNMATFALVFNILLGLILLIADRRVRRGLQRKWVRRKLVLRAVGFPLLAIAFGLLIYLGPTWGDKETASLTGNSTAYVIAIQPNVPMSGLDYAKWANLRARHSKLAESALKVDFAGVVERELKSLTYEDREERLKRIYDEGYARASKVVIFPESPMNFMYERDAETRSFIDGFAARNNVSVIFNSAEPDGDKHFFNSAVMVAPGHGEVVQYDKIYLLPFGESVPVPLRAIVPAFVGSFSYGSEYDLLPLGDAKGGVMICFESHFGELSRQYVRNGADVLIEMTNDGYLGPTPVLRQHLANAVFRAVETNRPVLRVTNVGITAYINERGQVIDPTAGYTEDTRVWSVARSDGSQTLYVRWGDWFAWVCVVVTLALLALGFNYKRIVAESDK